ncbi:metallophosphoesterase [Lacticaseibacillus parahuelsenbergensis]|uniref:Phosphoesterase n=1 Tax=Lacticaseibacillus parahuelsenbergensis TaxID=3068305 RepID=A0ABY9L5K3_9LACO|nr:MULTISPECIES: metallophosphoesterase [Lacticaseibacillus]MDE3281818.1 metallophosphoesterase [Lacticaseibacillus casei]WLV78750.1 metallophosphoesterase [Lacticaseibacillus sp. NCIMB 15471]
MKILAVSDTHGDREILATILKQQPDLDGYFYAGDSELPADDSLFQTYHAVEGNMDFDPNFPMSVTTTIKGITIFMTHGHRFGVNFGLDKLMAAGEAAHAQLVIFGHTHQLGVEERAGMVILNPGSISQPRGQFANLGGTYATVSWTDDKVHVDFLKRDGGIVAPLSRDFLQA